MSTNNVISFSSIKTKAAIAAIETLQREHDLAMQSPASLEHERRHAARIEARAERLRSELKLVKN